MALDTKPHLYHHDHQHSNYIESPEDIFSSWSIHAPHPTMVESNNHHHNMHHEGHRTLSAEDLTAKLQRLHEEQQQHAKERSKDSHHHPRPARGQPTFQIDPALQKRTHDAIYQILDRLERQRESNFMTTEDTMPGMAENGADRLRPVHRLNPNLLMRDSSTLRQSHGNANLRHSCG